MDSTAVNIYGKIALEEQVKKESEKWRKNDMREKLWEELDRLSLKHEPEGYSADAPPDDLVRGVLGSGEPVVMGGIENSLTSLVAIDLAVCLSAAEPSKFLGYFDVDEFQHRVFYLNYGASRRQMEADVARVAKARGVRANDGKLHILNLPPALNDDEGLENLQKLLWCVNGDAIVIIDSLCAALRGKVARRSEVVGHLSSIFQVCQDYDSQPIFIHNSKGKNFFGQWINLNKVGGYENGHQRWQLEVGSRAGFGGVYNIDIAEGRLSDPGGRVWETTVSPLVAKPASVAESAGVTKVSGMTSAVLAAITDPGSADTVPLQHANGTQGGCHD